MRRLLLLLCIALVALPAAALAREQVVVILNAEPLAGSKGTGVMRTVRSHLSDMPIRLIVEDVKELPALFSDQVTLARKFAEHHAADKVLWLNGAQGQVFMYFPEPGGERVLARIVEAKTAGERAEAIAIIARNFVKASMEAPPPPPPPPPPQKPEVDHLFLKWGYAADFFGSESPSPHGLFSTLALHLNEEWLLYLGGWFLESASASRDGVTVTVQRYPIEVGAGYRLNFDPWHLGFSIGGILEILTSSVESALANAEVLPRKNQVLGAGYLGISAARDIGKSSELFAELGASFFFKRVEFVPGTDIAGEPLVSTWLIRPMIKVGLNLGVF